MVVSTLTQDRMEDVVPHAGPTFGVISRCSDLRRCTLSHAMSFGFSLSFVSFFQNMPTQPSVTLSSSGLAVPLSPKVSSQ